MTVVTAILEGNVHKSVEGGQTFWTVEGYEDDGELTTYWNNPSSVYRR